MSGHKNDFFWREQSLPRKIIISNQCRIDVHYSGHKKRKIKD